MWRKNRSKSVKECTGVDINRNWKYQWGPDDHTVDRQPNDESAVSSNHLFSALSWFFTSVMHPQNTGTIKKNRIEVYYLP